MSICLRILLITIISLLCQVLSSNAQLIKHSYRFYNTLSSSSSECGPNLIESRAGGNCAFPAQPGAFINDNLPFCGVARPVYHNNLHSGLQYSNAAGTIGTTYTIHLYVKTTNFGNTWARIIDFSNGTSDAGIYYKSTAGSQDRCLEFFPNGIVGACPYFNSSTYYLLTFTRNGITGIIDVYVNNALFVSYNDVAGRYVGTPGLPIYIYRDDNVVPCESGEANFAYLSFTNEYSSQATVNAVYNDICSIANSGGSADFSITPPASCNLSQQYTVTYNGDISPPGNGFTFTWEWDGATIISGSGMGPYVVKWNTPGTKNIKLTVTNTSCGVQSSIIKQMLIQAGVNFILNHGICEGWTYEGYSSSGTYIDTFPLPNGCDSIRTLNLTVMPNRRAVINIAICEGQSYFGYSSSGTYIDTFLFNASCDSIRTLNLIVKPKSFSNFSQSICQGQSYMGHSTGGIYTDTLVASNGCDSIRTLNLTVNTNASSVVNKTICEGEVFFGYTTPGVYRDTLVAANGCDSIRTLNLSVNKKPVPNLGPDQEICNGDSVILSPGLFSSYLWQDGSALNYFVARNVGTYSVTVSNNCGSVEDEIILRNRSCEVYFPSAFTPNGDSRNDVFRLLNAYNISNFYLIIYNQWGEKIFESKDPAIGWNGKYKGQLQGNGVYAWYCIFKKNNAENILKGTVLLVR